MEINNFEPGTSVVKVENGVIIVSMSSAIDQENVLEIRMSSDLARHLVAQLERALNAHAHYMPTQ